jgi:hypothetical protein
MFERVAPHIKGLDRCTVCPVQIQEKSGVVFGTILLDP